MPDPEMVGKVACAPARRRLSWTRRTNNPRTLEEEVSLSRTFVCAALIVTAACSGSPPPASTPETLEVEWSQTGVASWYGHPFHGRRTANGEVYDMDGMTAAHKELPFGTRVRVENLDNGRVTEVRINDRGPFVDDRIIDLSRAAAREVGMLSSGTAPVRIVIIALPSTCREVQVGAFRDSDNAAERLNNLRDRGLTVRSESGADGVIRIIAGPFNSADAARRVRDRYDGVIQPC